MSAPKPDVGSGEVERARVAHLEAVRHYHDCETAARRSPESIRALDAASLASATRADALEMLIVAERQDAARKAVANLHVCGNGCICHQLSEMETEPTCDACLSARETAVKEATDGE